jgi:ABC-type antimicrobial peptide transport system, ATPase component
MLKIINACISFGNEPLFSNFNLHLGKGEIACISGKSGKGKTSLLNAIMGFVPLKEGEIYVNDILLNKKSIDKVRRYISWVPQELALPSEWVSEMINMPFQIKANKKNQFSKEDLFACFNELDLSSNLYNKRVMEISGGQRQRIMLAVAALLQKPLIIIDEPTSALDEKSTGLVLDFFKKKADSGTAILVVSHHDGFANGCDKQIFL